MMKFEPFFFRDRYYLAIEATIRRALDDILYKPLIEVIGVRMRSVTSELKNSKSALYDAIARGDIWYEDDEYKGSFNGKTSAAIIRLGGVYNVRSRSYSLEKGLIPVELRLAQEHADSRYKAMRLQMISVLNEVDIENHDLSILRDEYEKTIEAMEIDFEQTLPRVPFNRVDNPAVEGITIEAKMTPEQQKIIAEEWAQNLELYIQGWTQKAILDLRKDIQPQVLAGGRAASLEKSIRDSYGVSARKAKFLARQETSLLVAKFRETRYADIGIDEYQWSDSHDVKVRHDHHELNGKIFRFDNPPVSNKKTGARNNPGQDFGCRCNAIPVVR
jgi:SPP1 gp7 family putative phage head morphogenesis protein